MKRTKAELADLDAAIVQVVEDDWPVSLRGVFYRVVSLDAVCTDGHSRDPGSGLQPTSA